MTAFPFVLTAALKYIFQATDRKCFCQKSLQIKFLFKVFRNLFKYALSENTRMKFSELTKGAQFNQTFETNG